MATQPAEEKIIVTLEAKGGKKFDENGETVATYWPGRTSFIVFMPRGTVPKKEYRVKLVVVTDAAGNPRRDGRGEVMYRGVPATPEYKEEWRANGDGTASRATIATSWTLEETVEGVRETRPLEKRERNSHTDEEKSVVWGADLASTSVEVATFSVVLSEEEQVGNGAVVWRETARRREPQGTATYPAASVQVFSWPSMCQDLARDGGTGAGGVRVHYQNPALANLSEVDLRPTVGQLAGHLRSLFDTAWPVCSCGRERMAAHAGKAECGVCEREFGPIRTVSARFAPERRVELGAVAVELLALKAHEGADGELLATTLAESLRENRDYQQFVCSDVTGYPWYYAGDGVVWGSKFSPAALEVLGLLPQAGGRGLLRMAQWLSGSSRYDSSSHRRPDIESWGDFFFQTQVKGEEISPPEVTAARLDRATVGMKLVDLAAIRAFEAQKAEKERVEREEAECTAATLRAEQERAFKAQVAGNLAEQERAQKLRRMLKQAGAVLEDEPAMFIVRDGQVYAYAGVSGSLAHWSVQPMLEPPRLGVSSDGRELWARVTPGQKVQYHHTSASRSTSYADVTVRAPYPEEVRDGRWDAYPGQSGKTLLVARFLYEEGREIAPAEPEIVWLSAKAARPVTPVNVEGQKKADLSKVDLSKLFGGAAKTRR